MTILCSPAHPPTPVALLIEKGKAPQLVDASRLWGLDTYETDDRIHDSTAAAKQRASARQGKTWYATRTSFPARNGWAPTAGPAWAALWAKN